jgi:hypothetical protein
LNGRDYLPGHVAALDFGSAAINLISANAIRRMQCTISRSSRLL